MVLACVCVLCECMMFFFFKQKTAYEMRISDWSSDVCSSDLCQAARTKVFNQREAPDAAASRAPLLAVLPASSAANQLPDRLVAGGDPHVPVGHFLEQIGRAHV